MYRILNRNFIINLCVCTAFVYYTLNVQYFLALFISDTISQIGAYTILSLGVITYIFLLLNEKRKQKPILIHLWRLFFLIYLVVGFFANSLHHYYSPPFLKILIPFFFFLSFSEYLINPLRRLLFLKLATITFCVSNALLIYFQSINFSIDHSGIYEYEIARAGGVQGDANNATLVALLSLVLLYNFWKPKIIFFKIVRFLCIIMALYAMLLAFSKTGIVILILIFFIQQLKKITVKRLLILFVVLPVSLLILLQSALNSDLLTQNQQDRLENVMNIITLNVDKVDSSHRDTLLLNMLDYVFENPILGNGLYFSTDIRGHNTIIGVWADSGIFAFIMLLCIIAVYIRSSLRLTGEKKVMALSIILILTFYMLSLQTVINQPYLIGIFVFLCYFVTTKTKKEHNEIRLYH